MEGNYKKDIFSVKDDNAGFMLTNQPFELFFFDSVADCVNLIEKNKSVMRRNYNIDTARKNWIYGDDVTTELGTKNALIEGYVPENLIEMFESKKANLYIDYPELLELERHARNKKRKKTYTEDGGDLNIDRYMSGEPEYWQSIKKELKKKSVKILFNGWISAHYDVNNYVKNMVTIAAMVDILKTAGISVELWHSSIFNWSDHYEICGGIFAKIKGADEPIDIMRILSTGLPGLCRWYYFMLGTNLFSKSDPLCGHGVKYGCVDYIQKKYEFDAVISPNDDMFGSFEATRDLLNKILL